MSITRCPRCGLVAAFGTAEQRFIEIKQHSCIGAQRASSAHPSNWTPDGAA